MRIRRVNVPGLTKRIRYGGANIIGLSIRAANLNERAKSGWITFCQRKSERQRNSPLAIEKVTGN